MQDTIKYYNTYEDNELGELFRMNKNFLSIYINGTGSINRHENASCCQKQYHSKPESVIAHWIKEKIIQRNEDQKCSYDHGVSHGCRSCTASKDPIPDKCSEGYDGNQSQPGEIGEAVGDHPGNA